MMKMKLWKAEKVIDHIYTKYCKAIISFQGIQRTSVKTGPPNGTDNWLTKTVTALGLESQIRPKGRPKKKKESE